MSQNTPAVTKKTSNIIIRIDVKYPNGKSNYIGSLDRVNLSCLMHDTNFC